MLHPGIHDALLSVRHLVNTDASLNNQSITQRDFERRRYSVPGVVTKQVLRMVSLKLQKLPLTYLHILLSAAVITAHRETRHSKRDPVQNSCGEATENRPNVYSVPGARGRLITGLIWTRFPAVVVCGVGFRSAFA